jgi:chromosomal replication initiator protein
MVAPPVIHVPSRLTSFPLERPSVWIRRREGVGQWTNLLPYFLAGEENRLAAFVAMADHATLDLGNPLLVIGPGGAGKSALALHLAARLACSHHQRFTNDNQSATASEPGGVLYFTAVDFARAYAQAVAADDLQPLRDQLHQAPVLVLDDLHLIVDKSAAQDELGSRIDARTQDDRPTVLTSRRLPMEIRGMRPLLASRAVPGLTIPLSIPCGETRLQLLRELCACHELELSSSMIQWLDQRLDSRLPARSMEAAVKQIVLWSRMHDRSPTTEALEHAIQVVGGAEETGIAEIASSVAKYFRLRQSDLRSSSRKQNFVRARSLAMFLGRRLTSKSMQQIGEYFGGRDHTTVLHAIRKVEGLLEHEADLRRAADEIQESLSASP